VLRLRKGPSATDLELRKTVGFESLPAGISSAASVRSTPPKSVKRLKPPSLVLALRLRRKIEHEGTCDHIQLAIPHILAWLRRPRAHHCVSSLLNSNVRPSRTALDMAATSGR
jgi:hypothetical protein